MSGVAAFVGPALTAFGVAGALVAVRQGRPWAYGAAKGVASLGFLVTALAVGAAAEGWTRWALVALAFSAAGDVALAVRSRGGFLGGLALFLLAHATFAVAFAARGVAAVLLVAAGGGVALALGLGWRAWRGRLPEAMRAPVAAYALVLGTMVALALATGAAHRAPALVVGALLVAGSDLAVARERFATKGFVNKAIGLPTYYLGQTLVALALVGP
ncbi:MAG: lysoplasmalogenase family protein [Trueperaceae bacterium]|nr:lysoplasmalogenase family protein [Trueperaceae bacterium]